MEWNRVFEGSSEQALRISAKKDPRQTAEEWDEICNANAYPPLSLLGAVVLYLRVTRSRPAGSAAVVSS